MKEYLKFVTEILGYMATVFVISGFALLGFKALFEIVKFLFLGVFP